MSSTLKSDFISSSDMVHGRSLLLNSKSTEADRSGAAERTHSSWMQEEEICAMLAESTMKITDVQSWK